MLKSYHSHTFLITHQVTIMPQLFIFGWKVFGFLLIKLYLKKMIFIKGGTQDKKYEHKYDKYIEAKTDHLVKCKL